MDFPSDAQIFAETSEDGTLMLRECVENAAESEFKCEMKQGEQGRVSFLLNSVQNLILTHAVHRFPRPLSTCDYWSCLIDISSRLSTCASVLVISATKISILPAIIQVCLKRSKDG